MYFGTVVDFYRAATIVLCITVPLALWKLIDIFIWLARHVRVVIS